MKNQQNLVTDLVLRVETNEDIDNVPIISGQSGRVMSPFRDIC